VFQRASNETQRRIPMQMLKRSSRKYSWNNSAGLSNAV